MTRTDLARILVEKLSVKVCWSDFNRHRKIWQRLSRLSSVSEQIIKENEVPDEPNTADYQDNEC